MKNILDGLKAPKGCDWNFLCGYNLALRHAKERLAKQKPKKKLSSFVRRSLEATIVGLLPRRGTMSVTDLQETLRKAGYPEAASRVAVIRLAEAGRLVIRTDRLIERPKKKKSKS